MTRRSTTRKSRTAQASLAENEVENVQPHVDETTTMNPHDGVEGAAPHDGAQADDAHLPVCMTMIRLLFCSILPISRW